MNAFYRLAIALALIAGAFPLAGGPAGSSGRYLVIVDTSRSMRHRSKAMLQTVEGLLNSGMQGELSGGETLGLWTFNQDLYTGRFPLQVWASQEQEAIARRTLDFLKAQGCEKRPSLDKVIPALEEVVKSSGLITIILISAGDAKMRGTPFDDPINEYYARWYSEQQKGQVPLVTVLRAWNGKMTGWSVRPAAGPVEFPPLPPPEAPLVRTEPSVPAPVPAPAPEAVQPQMAPPLILSGKKLLADKTIIEAGEAPPPSAPSETSPPALTSVFHGPKPLDEPPPQQSSVTSAPRCDTSGSSPPAEPQFGAAHPIAASVPAPKPLDSSIAPPGRSISAPTPSGLAARVVQPPSVSRARPLRVWAESFVAGGCCLAFGLFRLRNARQAPPLSLITRSLGNGSGGRVGSRCIGSLPVSRASGPVFRSHNSCLH